MRRTFDEESGSDDPTSPGAESSEDFFPSDPVRLPIESVLDLHSFPPRDVDSLVLEYLLEASRAGFEEVRIIHGRGIGVQREIVRAALSRSPLVISFRDAPPEAGGWGATIAFIRTDPQTPR